MKQRNFDLKALPENGKIILNSRDFVQYANQLLEIEEKKVKQHLRNYDSETTFRATMYCKGCVSELFNVLHIIDLEDFEVLTKSFLDLKALTGALEKQGIDNRQIDRIANSVFQVGNMLIASSMYGVLEFSNTMGEVFDYIWKRRIYFDVAPDIVLKYCNGHEKTPLRFAFSIIPPLIDCFLISITSTYKTKMMCMVSEDVEVELTFRDGKCTYVNPNAEYNILDPMYLQPQRRTLQGHVEKFGEKLDEYENERICFKSKDKENVVYSYNEYLDNLTQTKIMYEGYVETVYGISLERFMEFFDSFEIDPLESPYSKIEYQKLRSKLVQYFDEHHINAIKKDIISEGSSAVASIYLIRPFIRFGDYCYTTVVSLCRFVSLVVEREAQKSKKYQIQTGYDFEKSIKEVLNPHDFVIKEEKRIKKNEFDVITEKCGRIYNFQCKNYYLNSLPRPDELKEFVKDHKRLIKSFETALGKEKDREKILESKYNKPVTSILVSRFPIVSTNPTIISYQNFEEWLSSKAYLKV